MKVYLIHPPYSKGSTWGDFKSVGAYNPPIGICYIAAVLRRNGIQVKIKDAYVQQSSHDEILREIDTYQPDLVGVSSTSIVFDDAAFLSAKIRKAYSVPLVIGGPHVTIFPNETMESAPFDFGVIGEGEKTILEIIEHLKGERELNSIKGIIYREDKGLKRTENREPNENLDNLPIPAFDLLPDLCHYLPQAFSYQSRPVGYVMTSRGCPFSCIYCLRIMGKKFRAHSPERVIREVEYLIKHFGVKEIHFCDDCFAVDKKRAHEICDLILERKLVFKWKCITHANSLDFDLMKKMKKAGCWFIGIGVETGDPRVMKFIKKKVDLERLQRILAWADMLKIAIKGFFILGFPSETHDSIKNTINYAMQNPFYSVSFNIAYLNPTSEMDKIADDFGRVNRRASNISAYCNDLSFVPFGFKKEELIRLRMRAILSFYLRPSQILRMLKRNKNIENYTRASISVFTLLSRSIRQKLSKIG